jgi:squalene-hopene/tetraprenyl-beta-curcumene cyclase
MAPTEDPTDLTRLAQQACTDAREYAYAIQNDDHWYGELLSNATITAEQVFFYQSLGKTPIPDGEAYKTYLLNTQNADGSWSLAPHEPGDLSTTCEAYLALKILGKSLKSDEMNRAQQFILRAGGVARVRMFTRIYFAQFGLFPWNAVPELPAEFILIPDSGWISIYRLSSWARSTIIPLMIISHHRPVYALPNGRSESNDYLDELWIDPRRKCVPYSPSLVRPWESDLFSLLFSAIDNGLHLLGGLRRLPLRSYARERCVKWILERQEQQGDWAGIIPPMHSGIQALLLEGYKLNDPVVKRGIQAIERFTWQDTQGKRLQSCVSPVT